MTELRDPAVAPHLPPAGTEARAPATPLLASEEFEGNEAPTIVDQRKAAEIASHARTRPLLGPAAWIGGTTLWSYVVAGQFVLRANMPEVLGIAFVVGVLVTTAYVACRRSLELLPARGEDEQKARFVKPTWVGVAAAAGVVFVASLVASGLGDAPAMLLLLIASGGGVVFGQLWTGRPRERLRAGRRALGVVAWAAAVVLGLVVVLSAVR